MSLTNLHFSLSGSLRCAACGLLALSSMLVSMPSVYGQSKLTINCSPATGPSQVGVAYSASCTATGGISPYKWFISVGTLPSGLTFTQTTNGPTIGGTPRVTGDYSFTIQVSDNGRSPQVATQLYSGIIRAPAPAPPPLSCDPTSGPSMVGVAYTARCTAPSGFFTYSWSISAGALPAGLSLNASGVSAVISGAPTAPGDYGYTVRVIYGSAAAFEASLSFAGTITRPISMTCDSSTGPATVGTKYSANCSVSGGRSPYTWSITSGLLPPGLALTSSTNTATVSGTPTAPGDYSYAVQVTDSSTPPQSMTQSYKGAIRAPVAPLALKCSSTSGPSQVGSAYAATCAVTGGTASYNWSISAGLLPAGLSLNASGSSATIGGTPTTSGDYAYTLRVIDSSSPPQTLVQSYTGTIAPRIPPPDPISMRCDLAAGPSQVGSAYVATCTVTGGTAPYNWSISAGLLPGGLSLSASGNTATISGTPTSPGPYGYSVRVADNSASPQTMVQSYTGTIAPRIPPPDPISMRCDLAAGPSQVGSAYVATCAVTGGTAPYNWSISAGLLPGGLSLNVSGSNATISGTPTTSGDYAYTLRVIDSGSSPQTATQAYRGTIGAPAVSPLALRCNPATGPSTVGTFYSAICSVSGGTGSYDWSINPGTLPAGVTLNPSGNLATISGTPTVSGPYSYSVRVADSGASMQPMVQAFVGTVGAPSPTPNPNPSPSPNPPPNPNPTPTPEPISMRCDPATGPSQIGSAYAATCTVAGGTAPYNWSISAGSLPGGLSLNASGSTARISGTPTTAGEYAYTLRVIDSSASPQSETQAYSGTIRQPTGPLKMSCSTASGPAQVAVPYTATCAATGGNPPYTWSINSGALPGGLSMNAPGDIATISGTPTVAGSYSYVVSVRDAGVLAGSATQPFSGAIRALEVPAITIMVQAPPMPTQPIEIGLQLSAASPVSLQGTLSLTFRALPPALPAGYSDPALQFVSGGRTLDFAIPAGVTTVSLQNRAIQQGTVAGDITVSLVSLRAGTTDVMPQPPPFRTVTLPVLPPVITPNSVRITNSAANSIDVEFTAYSTPRDLIEARYTFDVVSGTRLIGSAMVPVDVRNAGNTWYASGPSQTFGSLFRLRMRFTVEGDPNSISSVTVTLSNSAGTSAAVIGRR